jgi:acetyltransferase
VIISAGFSERGVAERSDLQAQLGVFAEESGIRLCGPNCLGLANVKDDIWASASSRMSEGLSGPIGMVCQSGASAFGPFLVRAIDNGIGFSYIVSTGNEADLDFADFARYLLDDDSTRVIAGFVEGFKDARKLLDVAKLAAERGKPIVLIKIGRSSLGAQAALHTPPRWLVMMPATKRRLNSTGLSVCRTTMPFWRWRSCLPIRQSRLNPALPWSLTPAASVR